MALSGTIGLLVLKSGQPVGTVVWFRCLLGALSLLAWLTVRRGWTPMGRSAWAWLVAGAAALILNWLLLFSSYRLSGIGISTVVYHVQPFFLILLAALVQREAPDWRKMPWLFLALVGVALTAGLHQADGASLDTLIGVGMALSAALLYAIATLATKRLSGIAPAQIAGLQLLLGVGLLSPWADLSVSTFSASSCAALLTLGLVHTGWMYNLMYTAYQRLSAQRIAVLSFIYPLVAIVVDLLVFRLALDVTQVVGMALILLAILAHQRGWTLPWPLALRGSIL